ncbi:MAG: hypothetical protein Q8L79_04280 [Methylobacter sp.]|uniref:hypothetical protein n=1 Tax=Methylobacter sp. TaxID=2051955 RepID=UPI0027315757|nr:hypothetical protein [Methylobacter sp.]MDP1664323.1 hypothetical protein [Methylobacter sp.]MDP1970489.1 hypothetical protein [Methylobacter sp.]
MLITAAFHTGIWTLLFLIVGMIKPKWPLFFLKKPDRFLVLIISTVLFMVSATLYGEGNRQRAEEEKASKETVSKIMDPSSAPVPVPEVPASKPNSPKN